MRYGTAIRRLRQIAADCHRANLPGKDPLLTAAYAFGLVLDGPGELPVVDVAFVLDRPADELPWGAEPPYTVGVVEMLRLDKSPVRWFWRPAVWPVWNHTIREPVRIWSLDDGPDKEALDALDRRDAHRVRLPAPSAEHRGEQVVIELETCLAHLRQVKENYWERDWRREHKGFGIYPEHHLWNAVWGYLDLQAAAAELQHA